MAVKVVIERQVKKGKEKELNELLKELRIRAIKQPGYISGETLQGLEDISHHLVISTWASDKHWKAWENNPERREMLARIEPLLTAPPRTTLFTSV